MLPITLTCAWFAGLVIGRQQLTADPTALLAAGAAAALLAAGLRRRNPRTALLVVIGAAVLLGAARFRLAQPTFAADPSHVAFYRAPAAGSDVQAAPGMQDQAVTLTGVVDREPEVDDRRQLLRVRTSQLIPPRGEPRPAAGLILVELPRYPEIPYGARLTLRGRLVEPSSTPEFSYRDYLARQGIHAQMRRPRVIHQEDGHGRPWLAALLTVKKEAQEVINRQIPPPEAGLLSGILLGAEHALAPELEDDFRATGVTHIVVISGFNISIIAAIFLAAATPLFGKKGAAYAAVAGIALYTVLVGGDAAVVRAAIMGGLYVFSERLLGRQSFAFASLFLAGLAMTVANPLALWDVGFQLSFAATLSLMLYADPLARWVRGRLGRLLTGSWVHRLMGVLNEAVLVTLAAQVLTLPLLIYYFQQFSLVSLLANAFILPAQPGVMLWGGLATLVGLVSPTLATPLAWIATLFLWVTIELAHLFAQVPWALVPVPFSFTALLAVYGITAGLTWIARQEMERQLRLRRIARRHLRLQTALWGGVALLILGWRWETTRPDGRLHVAFLELTEGEAVLIQSPTGRQILLDGGRYPTELAQRLGEQLPFGDRTLDLVIVTRFDDGRIGGLPPLFDRYGVDRLWLPGEPPSRGAAAALLTAAAEHETEIHLMRPGEAAVGSDGLRLQVGAGDGETAGLIVEFGDFHLTAGPEESWRAGGLAEVGGGPAAGQESAPLPRLSTAELGTIRIQTDGRRTWWTAYR